MRRMIVIASVVFATTVTVLGGASIAAAEPTQEETVSPRLLGGDGLVGGLVGGDGLVGGLVGGDSLVGGLGGGDGLVE